MFLNVHILPCQLNNSCQKLFIGALLLTFQGGQRRRVMQQSTKDEYETSNIETKNTLQSFTIV